MRGTIKLSLVALDFVGDQRPGRFAGLQTPLDLSSSPAGLAILIALFVDIPTLYQAVLDDPELVSTSITFGGPFDLLQRREIDRSDRLAVIGRESDQPAALFVVVLKKRSPA